MAKILNLPHEIHTFGEQNKSKQAIPIKYYIDENGCYICVSHALDKDGYPRIWRYGKDKRMSRYICGIVHEQETPKDKVVMHTCDNPACINPDHLKLGTQKENMADMRTKKRKPHGPGSKSSLTKEQAYYIKFLATETVRELARKYRVKETTIRNIRKGRTWKHLKREDNEQSNVA